MLKGEKRTGGRGSRILRTEPAPTFDRGAVRSLLLLSMGIATLLSSGCTALGPNFTRPGAPVAPAYVESDDRRVKQEAADYTQWWTVFEDPVLNNLIETARRQNPNLQVAGLRVLEARAQLGIAIGSQFPQQQQLEAGYTNSQASRNAANSTSGDLNYQTYNYSLSAGWELDFWGKYRRSVESADASMAASVADYDTALVSLTGSVASTYALVRIYEERLQVARENVELQRSSFDLVEARYRNGAVTDLDVQQAKAQLYDTESQIPSLEIGLKQAKHALSVFLGVPPSDLTELLQGANTIPVPPSEVAVGIPAELIKRRPDVRSAELQAAAQCAQIGIARAELFPRISLTGSFGFLASDSPFTNTHGSNFSDLFSWRSFTMTTGPTIQWPILNYGRIRSNVRVQDARFQQLLVNYANTVLTAAKEVEDSLVSFLKGQDQVALLSQSVDAAKRAVDLSTIQYREGAIDFQRLLTAQQSLVQQQDRLTQARGSVTTSLVSLYKALGGGWQPRLQKDFVSEETIRTMRSRTDWGNVLPVKDIPGDLQPPASADSQILPRRPDW
ncbi:MAG: efflux transporter outer membrane subunit [Desulfobacteraceae bacterium]|nr:efflux transporter outer membrane subunit [Desulfobacteraceae bacterium]